MFEKYTAEDYRKAAKTASDWAFLTTAEMLRQAADLMEREEKLNKTYKADCKHSCAFNLKAWDDRLKLFDTRNEVKKRDAIIKKLVSALKHLKRKICKDKFENCISKGNLSICEFCKLIEEASEVVKC